MTNQQHPITPPPPHLLKKFSAQAQAEASKRNGAGYLKTVATLCIEWFVNSQSTSNDRQIRSSEIAPPPELVAQWLGARAMPVDQWVTDVATQAAQWGADQELDACAEWVGSMFHGHKTWADELRNDRRPKPPTLKEQALKMLRPLRNPVMTGTPEYRLYEPQAEIIRRALEALDD
jgi:hypothetical protein